MKKLLLLFGASLLLLAAGCTKEKFADTSQEDGGLAAVTFVAGTGVGTKAVDDTDGAADYVNRCIMEVYYGDDLYTRKVARVNGKKAEFTVQMVSNRTYTVAFWADCATPDNVDAEGFLDLYYEAPSLKTIVMKGDYSGNEDARDAFFSTGTYTVAQNGTINGASVANVTLKRPFAQINVRTNDLQTVKLEALCPTHVNVKFAKMYKGFNAVSGEPGNEVSEVSYTAPVYKDNLASIGSKTVATLSMDYLFAEAEGQALVNILWQATKDGDATVEHELSNIPYKKNCRTNVVGALLTTTGNWSVEVDPVWSEPADTVDYYCDNTDNIGTLNALLKSEEVGKAKKGNITTDMPTDSDSLNVEFTGNNDGQDLSLTFKGTLGSNNKLTFNNVEGGEGPSSLNIDAPSGASCEFNGQNHVTLNGVYYESITGTVSATTLVISEGVKVNNLTMKAGGLEIHGSVTDITVDPAEGKEVLVRTSEGLSEANYEAVKGYIASGYAATKVGSAYNIIEAVCDVDGTGYASLADALASIPAGNSSVKTITLHKDVTLDWAAGNALAINKPYVVIDGQGFTISAGTGEEWDKYKVGGSSQKFGSYTLMAVSASNVTVKNLTVDGLDYRGVSLLVTKGGGNVLYENITYQGRGCAHYYGYAAGGKLTFKDCTVKTDGYGIQCSHEGGEQAEIVIEGCTVYGWNSFGACKSVTVTDSYLGAANDEGLNGVLSIFRPYCPATFTNTTFSREYADKTLDYVGLGTGSAVKVVLNGCKIEGDNVITDIVNYDNAFGGEEAVANSIFAFDPVGDETAGYYGGTFVTRNADLITVKSGHKVNKIAENIYTVVGEQVAKIGDKIYRDIHEAIADLQEGQTLSLTMDLTSDRTLEFKNGVEASFDLAGHTLIVETQEADGIVVSNGSTLNLTNSVAEQGVYQFNSTNKMYDGIYVLTEEAGKTSTLNIQNPVKLYASSSVMNAPIHAYAKEGKSVINMYAGTVVKVENTSGNQMTAIAVDQNSEFNMYGGDFELEGTFSRFSYSNDMVGVMTWAGNGTKQNGVVNILGGTFTVGGQNAFAQCVQIGYTNTSLPGATVNVKDAQITLGANPGGLSFAFTMAQHGTYNISGNIVVTKDASLSDSQADLFTFQWASSKRYISITGGTYFVEPAAAYVAFGYKAVEYGGVWKVEVDESLIYKEGGNSYGLGIPVGGVIWAPVNCGESAAEGGLLYQYGRKDGQTGAGTTPTMVEGSVEVADADPGTFYKGVSNWAKVEDNVNLWNSGTAAEPVKTQYDPCPDGWRVPTWTEITALKDKNSSVEGKGKWFSGTIAPASATYKVYIPWKGFRVAYGYDKITPGSMYSDANLGGYWTTTFDEDNSPWAFAFNDADYGWTDHKSQALSVRCVKIQ